MAVTGATIQAPADGIGLSDEIVRPRISCFWTAGVGPYDIEYTWDDDATFADGNGNRQQVTNTGVTGTSDSAVPGSDLGDLTTTWYLRVVVTDTDDSSTSTDTTSFDYVDPVGFRRYLHVLGSVGVGFEPTDRPIAGWGTGGNPDGGDGHTRDDFSRHVYLYGLVDTSQPCPFVFSTSKVVAETGDAITLLGQGFGDNSSPNYGAEVRLYESASFAASYVTLSISSISNGDTQDQIIATIPGGATSGYLAVVHTITATCSGSNFTFITISDTAVDVDAGWWVEAWDLDGDTKLISRVPVIEASFQPVLNQIGEGKLTVPADWDRLAEIIDPDPRDTSGNSQPVVSSMFKVYLHGSIQYAFFAERADQEVGDAETVTISGPGVESVMEWAQVYPFDFQETTTIQAGDWVYGSAENAIVNGTFDAGSDVFTNGDLESGNVVPFVAIGSATIEADSSVQRTGAQSLKVTPSVAGEGVEIAGTVTADGAVFVSGWLRDAGATGNTVTVDLVAPGSSVSTGSATSAHAGTQLTDTEAEFQTDGVAVGDIVVNTADGSSAIVVTVDSETQITHTQLTGGTDNDWTDTDSYTISDTVTLDTDTLALASVWQNTTLEDDLPATTTAVVLRFTSDGTDPFWLDDLTGASDHAPWESSDGGDIALTNDFVHEGSYALKVDPPVGNSGALQVFTTVPSTTYTITGRVSGTAGNVVRAQTSLGGVFTFDDVTLTGTPTFDTFTISGTTAADEVAGRLRILAKTGEGLDRFYVDSVTATPGAAAATPGQIIGDLIDDAQDRSTLTQITEGFSTSVDSAGETWDDQQVAVTVRRGQNYARVLEYFASVGFDWSVTDTLQLDVWNRRGTDFTGFVNSPVIRSGKLVGGKLTRRVPDNTVVFVEGSGGIYVQAANVSDVTALSRREAYVVASQASDANALGQVANNVLDQEDAKQSALRVDMIAHAGATPFLDFDIGDSILVDIPGFVPLAEYPEGFRVVAISVRLSDETPVYTVDLNWMVLEEQAAVAAAVRRLMSSTGEASISPSFYRSGDPTSSALLNLTAGVTGSQITSGGSAAGSGHTHDGTVIVVGDAATGDLTGAYPSPTVDGLLGKPISSTPGTGDDGKVLAYDETNDEWDVVAQSGGAGDAPPPFWFVGT